jgi:hypothetical protein
VTVREFERRTKQRRESDPALDREIGLNEHQVLTFLEWCRLNKISPATGRRIRQAGKGPRFIQLSDRRIGVTVADNRRWQRERALAESNHDD